MRGEATARGVVRLLAAICALSSGCLATETGNPPADPAIDRGVLTGDVAAPPTPGDPVQISVRGAAGAVRPALGEAEVWNLQQDGPPARGVVAEDGRFEVSLTAFPEESLQLRVRADDRVSEGVDLELSGGRVAARPPVLDCLVLEPGVSVLVREGDTRALELRNDCSTEVTRGRARLRGGVGSGLALADEGPLTLAPGASVRIELRASAPLTPGETLLLVPLVAPMEGERALYVLTR